MEIILIELIINKIYTNFVRMESGKINLLVKKTKTKKIKKTQQKTYRFDIKFRE